MGEQSIKKILVVGDPMTDKYLYARTSRLSPEAPVPIFSIWATDSMLGGAANVAYNATVMLPTGVELNCMFGKPATQSIVKTRVLDQHSGAVLARIDLANEELLRLPNAPGIEALLSNQALVVIADYCKGTLDTDLRSAFGKIARYVPTLIDTKADPEEFGLVPGLSDDNVVWLPSQGEYRTYHAFFDRARCVVRKQGKDGAIYRIGEHETSFKALNDHPRTVIGAGDVVMAAFAVARARGMSGAASTAAAMKIVAKACEQIGTARIVKWEKSDEELIF